MSRLNYLGNCTSLDGDLINVMKHAARSVTRRVFLGTVDRDRMKKMEKELGYDRHLPMARDWHVSYFLSEYDGVTCAYFVWSAYDYVFVDPEKWQARVMEQARQNNHSEIESRFTIEVEEAYFYG